MRKWFIGLALAGLVSFADSAVASIQLPFGGGKIKFTGNGRRMSFPSSFEIDSNGGTAAGGNLTISGNYTIDGSFEPIPGESSVANVTGRNGFSISDPLGGPSLTGDVWFGSITTFLANNEGILHYDLDYNVSFDSYSGDNPALRQLASDPSGGIMRLNFSASGNTVEELLSGSATVFASGRVSSSGDDVGSTNPQVPEPASLLVWSFLGMCVGMATYRKWRKCS